MQIAQRMYGYYKAVTNYYSYFNILKNLLRIKKKIFYINVIQKFRIFVGSLGPTIFGHVCKEEKFPKIPKSFHNS